MIRFNIKRECISLSLLLIIFGVNPKHIFAQASPSVLFVPLIGITSVPSPLALPNGPGYVTYDYAVKNFLPEIPLTNIHITDGMCSPITYITGDDNKNSVLDYNETWRYRCSTKLTKTTHSTATVVGNADTITTTHKAHATVIVGSSSIPPLVSIVNITKVAYPLSLPTGGGTITYTYKVTNPGIAPLRDVKVTDNKCNNMSGKLGDTNGNNHLDIQEVWIYTCTTLLKQTTTNTVKVSAFANGLEAIDYATITVNVANSLAQHPGFPNAGGNPNLLLTIKTIVWSILIGIFLALSIFLIVTKKKVFKKVVKR